MSGNSLRMKNSKQVIREIIKTLLTSATLLANLSFLSFVFNNVSIPLRTDTHRLIVGFPFKIFEQFYVNDCSIIKGWFIENAILNYSFIVLGVWFFKYLVSIIELKRL